MLEDLKIYYPSYYPARLKIRKPLSDKGSINFPAEKEENEPLEIFPIRNSFSKLHHPLKRTPGKLFRRSLLQQVIATSIMEFHTLHPCL